MNWAVRDGWRTARLGECCEIVSGATPSTEIREYWDGEIPWATPRDLSALRGRVLLETAKSITRAGYESCSTSLLPSRAVLFSSRAPVGLVAIAGQPMCTNQGFKSLVPKAELNPEYLYWCLRSLASAIERRGSGTTFTEVSKEVISRFEIPLPPLEEQSRIAAILDKADAILRKRRESLRLLNAFLGSVFVGMFGDPVANEKGWMRARAATAIRLIEPGTSIKGDNKPPGPTEWAVLKISAVTSGWYLPSECKTVTAPSDRPINPKRGDLLFSRANTRELVAATCLVDRDVDRVFLPDKLWRITANLEVATAEYLRFLFADLHFRRVLTRHATGTSGSMLNVSQEKLLGVEVPLPPLGLQREFAKVVWRTFGLREHMLAAIEQSDEFLKTIAWQAFGSEPTGVRQPTAPLFPPSSHA